MDSAPSGGAGPPSAADARELFSQMAPGCCPPASPRATLRTVHEYGPERVLGANGPMERQVPPSRWRRDSSRGLACETQVLPVSFPAEEGRGTIVTTCRNCGLVMPERAHQHRSHGECVRQPARSAAHHNGMGAVIGRGRVPPRQASHDWSMGDRGDGERRDHVKMRSWARSDT